MNKLGFVTLLQLLLLLILSNPGLANDEQEIKLEGILLTSKDSEPVLSPWGNLKMQVLLLEQQKKIVINQKGEFEIAFGIFHIDNKSVSSTGDNIGFSDMYKTKSSLEITLFYIPETSEWYLTNGFIGTVKNEHKVFDGLTINIVGGKEKPIKIINQEFFDTTILIKGGKPEIVK